MNIQASAIKRGRKFDQVIDGARQVFMADGYEGASVDKIARVAGVSKATLYSYFPDKSVLFMEMARNECDRQAERALPVENEDLPVTEMLDQVGRRMLEFLCSPFAQRMFRICVGESDRFPRLGREFYESGPKLGQSRLVERLQGACTRGELRIDDLELAADQFAELIKADIFIKMVFNVTDKPAQAAIDRVVVGAVDTFMARYGA